MRTAAQIKLDVEVGAAIGQINRFTNKLKTVNQSMSKARAGAQGVKSGIGGWTSGIMASTGALLKYKAIMVGIQTVTENISKAMEDMNRRAEQSKERQLSFSNEMRNLVHMYGSGDQSISLDEITSRVRGAKVTDHAELLRIVSATISTKDKDTTMKEAVDTAITVAEGTGRFRGSPDQQRDYATGVMKLYDASGAAEAAKEQKRTTDEMTKAQMAYMDAYVQISPGRDVSASMSAGIPGVANLMRQGLSQSAAGATIATLATQAGDMEQRKSATAALNTLTQVKEAYIEAGATGELKDDADLQWALMTGTATDEQKEKYGKITNKVRDHLLGQVYSSDERINAMVEEKWGAGYTWKDVVDAGAQDEFKDQMSVGGALHGRAQLMSATTRLLQGGGDPEITKAYKQATEALIDPIEKLDESLKRYEETKSQEAKYGAIDVAAEEAERRRALGQERDATGRVAQLLEDQDARLDEYTPEDYGESGVTGAISSVNRGARMHMGRGASYFATYGSPEAQANYNAIELLAMSPKSKRQQVANELRAKGVSESIIQTGLRQAEAMDAGIVGAAAGGDGTAYGTAVSLAQRAIAPGATAASDLGVQMYNTMSSLLAEQKAANQEAKRQTSIMENEASRPRDVNVTNSSLPPDALQQNQKVGS